VIAGASLHSGDAPCIPVGEIFLMSRLSAFEGRIPAPLVALAMAGLMRLATPGPATTEPAWEAAATAALVASALIAGAAFVAFIRARTTIDPRRPEQATRLVTSGIYRFSRNPMYLSLVLLLVADAIRLWSLPALLGPVVFVLYVRRFHIALEERRLRAKFGADYAAYARRVRRWL
jgi:protein-S-isoprenylcysteine O-methyltransferase Ste14